jgi:flagellar basal-body rod protein FlgC
MIATNIALSGLQAATTRLSVSASNVANANTAGMTADGAAEAQARGEAVNTGYSPLVVDQTSVANYGVAAKVSASSAPPQSIYAPTSQLADANGIIAMPDVDPVAETMAQIQAVTAYRASLSAMRTSDEMDRTLLDSRI